MFLFQVQSDDSGGIEVFLNGTRVTNATRNINDSISNVFVDITRTETNRIISSFNNGVSITVTLSSGILNFVAALPQDYMGSTTGLLGNFNQNDTDDLRFPNGTLLEVSAMDRMIHAYGQECKCSN